MERGNENVRAGEDDRVPEWEEAVLNILLWFNENGGFYKFTNCMTVV